ncbi:hypothetical protein [Pseudomonas sp. 1152_12]|uniref:hypothetical protein n=1 Tax=Pseudomonas sp. 1152_12 TaxID=2604455 RepID=UPI0040633E41
MILAVDRFMAECRSLTNIIGNASAALVIAAREGEFDHENMAPVALNRGRHSRCGTGQDRWRANTDAILAAHAATPVSDDS